jgi:hypothetical protein
MNNIQWWCLEYHSKNTQIIREMIIQALWVGLCMLLIVAALEVFWPQVLHEGFQTMINVGDSPFWATHMPRRGDVGIEASAEAPGYIRDSRYFSGYVDVQRLSVDHDFCRMVMPQTGAADDRFLACALGGTQGLSSVSFRSRSVKQGFRISRDDYMAKLANDTMSYCRILKVNDLQTPYQIVCTSSTDTGFKAPILDITDPNPPKEIAQLLDFFVGIVFWLRLIDDMVDYAGNLTVMTGAGIGIEEVPPRPPVARTLMFDGINQFLRLGDSPDLTFGDTVNLRYLRAVSLWVKFDEFTNNAHIFDFGNGAGKDNVWLGIVGRGNAEAQMQPIRMNGCLLQNESTVPDYPSGAQNPEETTPQNLMETTSANVNEFSCQKPEVFGREMPPVQPFAVPPFKSETADLVYEIWDSQQRKLHVQVPGVFKLKQWTHVVITATNSDATRPTLAFYVNGQLANTEVGAWLPQNSSTTFNYVGKSNWMNTMTNDENADEYFKGELFDFRGYSQFLKPAKVKETYRWGLQKLGLPAGGSQVEHG